MVNEVELDLKTLSVSIIMVLLAASSIFLYVQNQGLQDEKIDAERQLRLTQETLEQKNTTLQETNTTVETLRATLDEQKQRIGDLNRQASKALVYAEYSSRTGNTGSVNVGVNIFNLGNTTAENIQVQCQTYRQNADPSYNTFSINTEELEALTARTVEQDVKFTETIQSSDRVSCTTQSCTGNCQPVEKQLETNNVETNRTSFN